MKNQRKSNQLIAITVSLFLILGLVSFKINYGEPVASNTKIIGGKTDAVSAKKEFRSGEEIFICIPLKGKLDKDPKIKLEIDGKEEVMRDFITYKSEVGLNYFSFALALDPKNHIPEQSFYKEGKYAMIMNVLSKLTPGKHKITFSVAMSISSSFDDKISLTIDADEAGLKKWADWSTQINTMDKEYAKKLEQ